MWLVFMKGVSATRGFTGLRSPVLKDWRPGCLGLFGVVVVVVVAFVCLLLTFVWSKDRMAGQV